MRIGVWTASLAGVAAFGIVPIAVLFARVFAGAGPDSPSPAETGSLWHPRLWALLARTIGLAGLSAAGGTLLGTLVGYRLGATRWPGSNVARILLVLPLLLPPYLHAVGWTTLIRLPLIYSFAGAVWIFSLAYFPVAMLFAEKALSLVSPSLLDAGRLDGNRWDAFLAARWPALRSALLSAFMITFLLVASDLGVPTILKVRVFNLEVFTRLAAFNDVASATLLVVPLLVVGFAVVGLERRFTIGDEAVLDSAEVEPPPPAGRVRIAANIAATGTIAVVALAVPVGAIAARGIDAAALRAMTAQAIEPGLNTLRYAGLATAMMTLVALGLAWVSMGAPPWSRRATDAVLVVGFAVPSTILALGLLACYGGAAMSRWISPSSLVVAALVVRYVILSHRIVGRSVARLPVELFDAAAVDGAGAIRALRSIALPLTGTAVAGALLVGFVLSAGEIGSTILLYPPGGETLPIALYSIEANAPQSYVAAMTLLLLGLLTLPAMIIGLGALARMVLFIPSHR